MILQQGLHKIAESIEGMLDHALVFSGGSPTQVNFAKKEIDGGKVEIWVKVPDTVLNVDKIQIIDTDGDVFIDRSKTLTRQTGRAVYEVFTIQVQEVTE